MEEKSKIILTIGRNNCGGRCLIKCHVTDGEITKITTQTKAEAGDEIPLTACAKGLNYHKTYVSERRLQYPMKRVGKRGEGKFERITWDEAINLITKEWIRIRDQYGPGSRHVLYGTGEASVFSGRSFVKRLLALDGGHLRAYNTYSSACVRGITPYVYGNVPTANTPSDWLNSSLIILWGHNPSETVFDSMMYYLRKAVDKGIPIIGIDPRKNDTIKKLNAKWYPIRPATDAALADAIAYELYITGRYDREFVETHCIGFTKESMPKDVPQEECYFSYLTGEIDGVKKDSTWAEQITGLPAEKIRELASIIWESKPCNILQGLGPQRNAYGEQASRAAMMLACLTGNVGISGGNAAGNQDYKIDHYMPEMPKVPNPYKKEISAFTWTDAIVRGEDMTPIDGVIGGERLDSNIKMIMNIAGNCLINQHSDINKTIEILRDESKCEFIVTSDVFMTASARYSDLVLPCTSFLEEENLTTPWENGEILFYNNRVIAPLYESRPEYDWLKEIARNLGLYDEFTEGRETIQDWIRFVYDELRKKEKELPDLEVLKQNGYYRFTKSKPYIAFREQRENLSENPYPTPSGKIEIFSRRLYEREYTDPFPPIPRYMSIERDEMNGQGHDYPLQLVGWHTKTRTHSTHGNNPVLERISPQRVMIHPLDAQKRGIQDGDIVLVYNQRGRLQLPAYVTEDIMPGVTGIAQGAWYAPDENGLDHGGCINVLTTQHPTPLAKGNPQHTNFVEIKAHKKHI